MVQFLFPKGMFPGCRRSDTVNDGQEAVDKLRSHPDPYRIVLMGTVTLECTVG